MCRSLRTATRDVAVDSADIAEDDGANTASRRRMRMFLVMVV